MYMKNTFDCVLNKKTPGNIPGVAVFTQGLSVNLQRTIPIDAVNELWLFVSR